MADLSDVYLGGEQDIITVGLNWYANKNVRFMLNYLDVDVEDDGAIYQFRPTVMMSCSPPR